MNWNELVRARCCEWGGWCRGERESGVVRFLWSQVQPLTRTVSFARQAQAVLPEKQIDRTINATHNQPPQPYPLVPCGVLTFERGGKS